MKIATLNINGYGERFGAWPARRARIADSLKTLAPEVVLLQAVAHDARTGENQAVELARGCGYRQWIYERANDGADVHGVAILSQQPLADLRSEPLVWRPNPEDPQRRVLLLATIEWNGKPLRLVNGHFSWVPSLNALQAAQTLAVLDGEHRPVVFAGDLNAVPDSETMKQIAAAGWIDAWDRLGTPDAGATFPADNPVLRIDYAWISPSLALASERIEIFGDESSLSDHRGLMITLAENRL